MAALPQFTYIFVIGLFFAFLDAWVRENDTIISSRSGLKLRTGLSAAGQAVRALKLDREPMSMSETTC